MFIIINFNHKSVPKLKVFFYWSQIENINKRRESAVVVSCILTLSGSYLHLDCRSHNWSVAYPRYFIAKNQFNFRYTVYKELLWDNEDRTLWYGKALIAGGCVVIPYLIYYTMTPGLWLLLWQFTFLDWQFCCQISKRQSWKET